LDAPRTLWQPSYLENSWIARDYAGFLPLIPRIQQSISQFFPGTEISFSEVNFGGGNHISGAIAAADYLGIFGKHGIYAAFFWPLTLKNDFISAGYNLYLDYDGEGNSFGTIGVEAGTSDDESSSIYASIKDKDAAQLNLVVLNKSPSEMDAIILINGNRQYSIASIARLEGEHADIRIVTDHTDSGELQIELPPFSASHLVLSGRPE
jgi:mannan endo-1,4-beta-mannosidase